jgi:osomolarity two-component system sensor histidine kinase SLN1
MRIRVGIREQLAVMGLVVVLVGLCIISVPTWMFVHGFVTDVTTQGLAMTASLKAAQLASHLDLLQSTCAAITTRLFIQQALRGVLNRTVTEDQTSIAVCCPCDRSFPPVCDPTR